VIRRHRKKLIALAIILLLPLLAHLLVGVTTNVAPPPVDAKRLPMEEKDGVRRAGRGWATMRGVRIVHLRGTPEEIGAQHTSLLHDRMVANEQVLWDAFTEIVPFSPARTLMFDIGRVQYRDVSKNFPPARARELAAEARAFDPDPYADRIPTYQRLSMLHALYDISLSFEHSPLIGCTSFALHSDTRTIFARAFDFEAAEVFDQDKAVFIVHEDGKLPFASVAWPGLVGVVTGMNSAGVAMSAHGARAREPVTTGIPVAFSLREALSTAHDAHEAAKILSSQDVMVSNIVFVADAEGESLVVERAPGVPAYVRSTRVVTNHFEGRELRDDEKNIRVRQTTSTLARRARMDELLATPMGVSVPQAVALLRDHQCAGGESCLLGDRRAIDAFIATHGVVADLEAKTLWVSEGPQLSGRFVKVDPSLLVQRPDGTPVPVPPAELETVPADEVMSDGRYAEGRKRSGGPLLKIKGGVK
jgi:isopenicillin-N N-acyltransferase like protein